MAGAGVATAAPGVAPIAVLVPTVAAAAGDVAGLAAIGDALAIAIIGDPVGVAAIPSTALGPALLAIGEGIAPVGIGKAALAMLGDGTAPGVPLAIGLGAAAAPGGAFCTADSAAKFVVPSGLSTALMVSPSSLIAPTLNTLTKGSISLSGTTS